MIVDPASNVLPSQLSIENVFDSDPAKWIINDFYREYIARHDCEQNKNADFTRSRREYHGDEHIHLFGTYRFLYLQEKCRMAK